MIIRDNSDLNLKCTGGLVTVGLCKYSPEPEFNRLGNPIKQILWTQKQSLTRGRHRGFTRQSPDNFRIFVLRVFDTQGRQTVSRKLFIIWDYLRNYSTGSSCQCVKFFRINLHFEINLINETQSNILMKLVFGHTLILKTSRRS